MCEILSNKHLLTACILMTADASRLLYLRMQQKSPTTDVECTLAYDWQQSANVDWPLSPLLILDNVHPFPPKRHSQHIFHSVSGCHAQPLYVSAATSVPILLQLWVLAPRACNCCSLSLQSLCFCLAAIHMTCLQRHTHARGRCKASGRARSGAEL